MLSDDEIENGFSFVMSELVRHAQMSMEQMKGLPGNDLLSTIHDANRRMRIIGRAADLRLRTLSEGVLEASAYHRRVDPDAVFDKVKEGFGLEYATPDFKGSTVAEDRARLEAWLGEAAKRCSTLTHFIPCHIGIPAKVQVDIGPVSLASRESAFEQLRPKLDELRSDVGSKEGQRQAKEVARTEAYFGAFQDVARVTVAGCDPKTSRAVADEAVHAALAYIHLMAGAPYTRRMRGGGPALRGDRRSTVALDDKGELRLSWSARWEGANIAAEAWDHLVSGEEAAMTQAAGVAIQTIVDRGVPHLAAARYLDAVAWYADAAREQSQPAAIVKYLTAMERLLWTGERGPGITKRLAERAAALCFSVDPWDFEELRDQVEEAYGLRSGIVHGRISADDPVIRRNYRLCERVARDLLMTWLARYGSGFAEETTLEKAKAHFDGFVRAVKADTAARKKEAEPVTPLTQKTVTQPPNDGGASD